MALYSLAHGQTIHIISREYFGIFPCKPQPQSEFSQSETRNGPARLHFREHLLYTASEYRQLMRTRPWHRPRSFALGDAELLFPIISQFAMTKPHVRPSDIRGYSRLAIDATIGLTNVVETMHHNIARAPGILGVPTLDPTKGITGLVYQIIRGVTHLVGGGIDAALAQFVPQLSHGASSAEREAVLAALNGVLGDHLAASNNTLAIPTRLRRDGQPLELTRRALAKAIPQPSGKVLLLVHGLCMNDLQWRRKMHDHGGALAADIGFTQVHLHYNSGLHISTNGRAFADLIEALLEVWPVSVEELDIIGHSMGGLVSRSACHYGKVAGHDWVRRLRKIIFLGTPHHGTLLERGGNLLNAVLNFSPYTAAFARLGKIRSAGITDLRYGSLLDEDWERRDRFAHSKDKRRAVPLPEGVQCYAVGASIAKRASGLIRQLLGDGLVPLRSALGRHTDPSRDLSFPESQRWIGYGMNHWDLLDHSEVYEQIVHWLSCPP
jgi:pimeloyl-ACP methyl ester carboxylesterase